MTNSFPINHINHSEWTRFLFDQPTPIINPNKRNNNATKSSNNISILRPSIPRVLALEVCRYLRVKDLTINLAVTSRHGYATVRDYGDQLESYWKRQVREDPLDQCTIDIESLDAFVPVCIPSFLFEMVDVLPSESLDLMFKSRLKNVVVGLSAGLQPPAICNLLATSMPHLRALRIEMERDEAPHFPISLRYADIMIPANLACTVSSIAHSCAKSLVRLALRSPSHGKSRAHSFNLIHINALTHLRYLRSEFVDSLTLGTSARHLRESTHLTHIECPSLMLDRGEFANFYDELLSPPLPFTGLRHCGIYVKDQLTKEIVPALSSLHASLTSLTPPFWRTTENSWLASLTRLTSLAIDCRSAVVAFKTSYSCKVSCEELVAILVTLTQLRHLRIHIDDLTESHMTRIMTALTSLSALSFGSESITSFQCLTTILHVRDTLRSLHFSLPSLPITKVTQLYVLSGLNDLTMDEASRQQLESSTQLLTTDQAQTFFARFPNCINKTILNSARHFTSYCL